MISIRKADGIAGDINISGAKNASLPIIVAACLADGEVRLTNVPVELNDVQVLVAVLKELGFFIDQDGHELLFRNSLIQHVNSHVSTEASKIRSSLLLLPLLLSLNGQVVNPLPGGCNLGDRKYDIHLDLLQKMGAQIIDNGEVIAGNLKGRFHGADLSFHIATTSGSESAILAAVKSKGITRVRNANTRPEVLDLINFFNGLGAKITYSTRYIEIEGVDSLSGGTYDILPDSHEAMSYIILAAMARGELKVNSFDGRYLVEDLELMERIGVEVFRWQGDLYVSARNRELKPFSMATSPYPGINSDMQPLLAALATTIPGESIITDTRFNNRFQYVDEMRKLQADIVNYENCAIVQGGKPLRGTDLYATDLRAGAALTFLACVADGESTVDNFYQVERGYADIIGKLKHLGANLADMRQQLC